MKITTVQWNVGGGKIRDESSDVSQETSYELEGIEYVIDKLKSYQPDIITLQETHADVDASQAAAIARALGWSYFLNDRYDKSHIDPSQGLCQSVISRFPLSEHSFALFFNPPFRKVMGDGSEWVSHDKGMTTCKAAIDGAALTIQTLHLIPFRRFDVDPTSAEAEQVVSSIENLIDGNATPYLLQGDFNHNDLSALFPTSVAALEELGGKEPTTPKGRIYDHVLYRGMEASSVRVDQSVLTDHFPVITTFEL